MNLHSNNQLGEQCMNLNSMTSIPNISTKQTDSHVNVTHSNDEGIFQQLMQQNGDTWLISQNQIVPEDAHQEQAQCIEHEQQAAEQAILCQVIMILPSVQDKPDLDSLTEIGGTKNKHSESLTDVIIDRVNDDRKDSDRQQKKLLINEKLSSLMETLSVKPTQTDLQQYRLTAQSVSGNEITKTFIYHNHQQVIHHSPVIATSLTNQNIADMPSNHFLLDGIMPHVQATAQAVTNNPLPTVNLPISIEHPQWPTALSQQIILFKQQNIEQAELRLDPAELGSLKIKLSMHNGKMQLQMAAAVSVVKEVLASALPYLRTSLAEQGIELQQTEVTDFTATADNDSSSPFQQHTQSSSPQKMTQSMIEDPMNEAHQRQTNCHSGLSVFA